MVFKLIYLSVTPLYLFYSAYISIQEDFEEVIGSKYRSKIYLISRFNILMLMGFIIIIYPWSGRHFEEYPFFLGYIHSALLLVTTIFLILILNKTCIQCSKNVFLMDLAKCFKPQVSKKGCLNCGFPRNQKSYPGENHFSSRKRFIIAQFFWSSIFIAFYLRALYGSYQFLVNGFVDRFGSP